MPLCGPELYLGCKGPAVERWQRIVGVTADGIYGPNTERATRIWQGAMGIPITGSVWASDWRAAAENERSTDYDGARWIGARNYRHGRAATASLIVLHSIQCDIRSGVAVSLARAWQRVKPVLSAHYVVDDRDIVQCVREADTAYTAGHTGNARGIHIELAGRYPETDWLVDGRAVFENAARLVADICQRTRIPAEPIGSDGLKLGCSGITTHASISEAWRESDHVDPGGPGDRLWPWGEFIALLA